jgi:hypothetical protein
MGMFDWYEPAGEIRCPECGVVLTEWQGKEGPNGLFVWAQGRPTPIDQRVDDETKWSPEEMLRFRLPARFTIWSYDCELHQPIEADCRAPDGIWNETIVEPWKARSCGSTTK